MEVISDNGTQKQIEIEIEYNMDPGTEVKYNVDPKWRLLLTSNDIDYFVQKCADHLNKKFEKIAKAGQEIVIVCILKGAVYFHVDLTRKLKFEHSSYFIDAKSYGNGQIQKDKVEILSLIEPSKFENKIVILIDELFDNGTTMINVKEKISELAYVPKENIYTCMFLKKDKKNNTLRPDFYGVLVPDVWLVGYGLDDEQTKREWKCVYARPKYPDVEKTSDDFIFENDNKYKLVLFGLQIQK